jgi:hypothetical protein
VLVERRSRDPAHFLRDSKYGGRYRLGELPPPYLTLDRDALLVLIERGNSANRHGVVARVRRIRAGSEIGSHMLPGI